MSDSIVGIDVSKESLDANCARGQRKQSRTFENSPDGWKLMLAWFTAMGSKKAHVCMEATGRHSLGVALALHDAGHIVSIANPAQIRDFARTKLGRNKTDKIDAVLIREYAGLFKPGPWAPPSPAMRRLCELQTVPPASSTTGQSGRTASAAASATASRPALPPRRSSISPADRGIDKAIRETIEQDDELRGKHNLLLSVVGVGETLAASLLAEMPPPEVLRRSAEMVAYAGLNPSHHRSGTSIDRPTRISKVGNATLRSSLYMPALSAMRYNPAIIALVARLKQAGRLKPKQIVVAAMRKLLVICFGVSRPASRSIRRSPCQLELRGFPNSVVRLETDHSAVPI